MIELKRNFPKKISKIFFEKFQNLKLITFTVFFTFEKRSVRRELWPLEYTRNRAKKDFDKLLKTKNR